MKPYFIIGTFLLLSIQAIAQNDFKCYLSSIDYAIDREYPESIIPKIRQVGKEYVKIPKMTFVKSGRRDKYSSSSWAIRYEGNVYINMQYSFDFENTGLYVKPKVLGKFIAIVINADTEPIIRNGGAQYGGGLAGVLMKNADKWGKNWTDKKGVKNKILLFMPTRVYPAYFNRPANAYGELLTKDNFNELLLSSLSKEQIKSLSFEAVIDIINEKNNE